MGSAIAEPCYVYVVRSEYVRPGCCGYVSVCVLYPGVCRCKDSTIEAHLVKQLGILLHALATGLIAKYNAKGYHHDVSVLGFLLLHPDEFTAPIKTTPYLFLKKILRVLQAAAAPRTHYVRPENRPHLAPRQHHGAARHHPLGSLSWAEHHPGQPHCHISRQKVTSSNNACETHVTGCRRNRCHGSFVCTF